MMTNHGVPLSKEEVATLTPYLAQNYPEKNKVAAVVVPGPTKVSMKIWKASTPGSRPHDPLAARDGSLWYTGQMANVLGRVDPKTGQVKEYPLKTAHSGPHGLVEDSDGNIWYTGNTGALIGKLDPKTAAVTEYPMPDPNAKDPHTLIFDKAGILWFTVQNANRIGRLDPKSAKSSCSHRPRRSRAPTAWRSTPRAICSSSSSVPTRWRGSIRRRWKSASTSCRILLPVRGALPSPATT